MNDPVGRAAGPASPLWEAAWAPYDEATYAAALSALHPTDTVLDIGAGDLRFARRAAQRVKRVIAVERQAALMRGPIPANLMRVCGDAWQLPYPPGVTAAVLLMRHCQHVGLVVGKLRALGCTRLITNARWGMGVEVLNPAMAARPLSRVGPGWYACLCGHTGFVTCAPEDLTDIDTIHNVTTCTNCEGYA